MRPLVGEIELTGMLRISDRTRNVYIVNPFFFFFLTSSNIKSDDVDIVPLLQFYRMIEKHLQKQNKVSVGKPGTFVKCAL